MSYDAAPPDAAPPAAVLFDMDGTLVDTEPYWIAAEYALVAEHGGQWSDDHAHALVGNALLVSAAYIREHGPVDLEPEVIVELLLDAVVAHVQDRIPWRPGARELLLECGAAGVPTALVTMSYQRLADAVVSQLPDGAFTTLVTGDQVTHGKPHPEPYLLACERLGVSPGQCVALEDSPTGLASASAAGCATIGIPHHVPIAPDPGWTTVATLDGVTLADLGGYVPR